MSNDTKRNREPLIRLLVFLTLRRMEDDSKPPKVSCHKNYLFRQIPLVSVGTTTHAAILPEIAGNSVGSPSPDSSGS